MAEPEEIVASLEEYFEKSGQLKGKKALVTAGPTYEAIDPVRFIGNHSSGKMGYALAEELSSRGADVSLITGPVHFQQKTNGINLVKVISAEEMYQACLKVNNYDIAVMAAAVADFTPSVVSDKKIKKTDAGLVLSLKRTKDILGTLGKAKSGKQLLVGFALETNNEKVIEECNEFIDRFPQSALTKEVEHYLNLSQTNSKKLSNEPTKKTT